MLYYTLLVTINLTLSLIMLLAACLWCRRKAPKNELLGLEGMVKLKNPDEVVITTMGNNESQGDLNLSTISNADSDKRASTAAHRSLPDIPIVDGDNGSELYETVADKRVTDTQNNRNKSPTPSLKKQTSVSQHSSISQADDVSSPYSRVRNSPHDYAKVRSHEHPYAQLNPPSTGNGTSSGTLNRNSQLTVNNGSLNRLSHHSNSSQNVDNEPSQAEIPAASAIAGMISASQDLPYMTPPIAGQHFSGDSQDSSKGYTSISVREPLANILAQQPQKPVQRNPVLSREVNDSHYATVSDDSDETYAAIEDPNVRNNTSTAVDIYTSGSETYAQIQPMQSNAIVVSVEINNATAPTSLIAPANNAQFSDHASNSNSSSTVAVPHNPPSVNHSRPTSTDHATPIPPPVDSLRAQMHSRQASSSSNNSSSVGNLGSPKPEKRQANSPLPPTPKSNLTSGRNSVISVIECAGGVTVDSSISNSSGLNEGSPQKKNKGLSPSRDIEGMYAKVMKKNKFSRNSPSSQNNSPVMTRKYSDQAAGLGVSPLDAAAAVLMESHKISGSNKMDKSRTRSNSYSAKDHGYETIPADGMRSVIGVENRKSDCYTHILQKERQQEIAGLTIGGYTSAKTSNDLESDLNYATSEKHYETIAGPGSANNSDPGYETLQKPKNQSDPDNEKKSSDYDPNYEVLKGPKYATNDSNSAGLSDDGYAKVLEKKPLTLDDTDTIDGYSKVKGEESEDGATGGYSTIRADANHNYASILEAKGGNSEGHETESDHYARIAESKLPAAPDLSLNSVGEDNRIFQARFGELPITSPSSVNSASLLNNSSTISSTNALTSSSTMSSRQTPSSLSQYESFTGSDTDPNYESVCYTNRENPYERLQPEYSDTQLSSSPITPEERQPNDRANVVVKTPTSIPTATTTTTAVTASPTTVNGPKVQMPNPSETGTDVVVDDYFQV